MLSVICPMIFCSFKFKSLFGIAFFTVKKDSPPLPPAQAIFTVMKYEIIPIPWIQK